MHVNYQRFKLGFSAVGMKVGDLRFESHHQIGHAVHNGGAKVVNLAGVAPEVARKAGGVRVQTHAKHGLVALGGCAELVHKGGAV